MIYLGETRVCVPLYDHDGCIAELKRQVANYPPALKRKIVQGSLWCAEFALASARASAGTGDVYCAAGCATRVVQYLTQALFALNEEYFITDKNACAQIEKMARRPTNYAGRINCLLANLGQTTQQL